nr:hypothetical protein [Nitrosomonas nitrosa]
MNFTIEGQTIVITRQQDGKVLYSIPLHECTETRSEGAQKNFSEWVDHLSSKTWMTNESLYSLAVFIHQTFPVNDIDWIETFVRVESKALINAVTDAEAPIDKDLGLVLPDDLSLVRQQIKIESEVRDDKSMMNGLREGVIERLRTLGLIK